MGVTNQGTSHAQTDNIEKISWQNIIKKLKQCEIAITLVVLYIFNENSNFIKNHKNLGQRTLTLPMTQWTYVNSRVKIHLRMTRRSFKAASRIRKAESHLISLCGLT
jgi:hypothetical protein